MRGPRKDETLSCRPPLSGERTPVRRNGTGPSRGRAREGYISPIPAEIALMRPSAVSLKVRVPHSVNATTNRDFEI
jgi:hypothetical protein